MYNVTNAEIWQMPRQKSSMVADETDVVPEWQYVKYWMGLVFFTMN